MSNQLQLSVGQHTSKGRKKINQDFHGMLIPDASMLAQKGIAIALADGISTSKVSQIASESAVKSFLTDYYCTSEAWTVKNSAHSVISATNSWLHAQSKASEHAYDMEKGYVCTFSVMVLKGHHAHIFHIGDTRIYRLFGGSLEQLTNDHKVQVSTEQSYLSRALGMDTNVEIDYRQLRLERGDIFLMVSDGVYEYAQSNFVTQAIKQYGQDLDQAARQIVDHAYEQGSTDNLTLQIIRIEALPEGEASDIFEDAAKLPAPPLLEARQEFEGFKIIRQIHASHRSHIYLAKDMVTNQTVTLKIPSIDLRDDPNYLKRFMMEEWIAKRLSSAHILKAYQQGHKRNYLYITTEFVEGQTLAQWMIDNPSPDIEVVRDLVEQIAVGLRAFHRKEMLHQDLRPENIMIDKEGTAKIIDFGSTKVAGVLETAPSTDEENILGTIQYSAPEYFIGEQGTSRSDLFSLGVITYQMLTGKLPFGTHVSQIRNRAQLLKLQYGSAKQYRPELPSWVDGALKKAVHPDQWKRYNALSEFIYDLRHPNKSFGSDSHAPFAERNPVMFWKLLCLMLGIIVMLQFFFF